MKKIDITGQRFGRLIVLRDTGKRYRRYVIWACKCDCGKLVEVPSGDLRSGKIKSCGCLWKEMVKKINIIHGDSRIRLYDVWCSMKSRCLNPKNKAYKYYGGKGIKICKEWKNNYMMFKNWALANGYKEGLTIDRIDNDGNYCPENCQWLTKSENSRNGAFKRWGKKENNNE